MKKFSKITSVLLMVLLLCGLVLSFASSAATTEDGNNFDVSGEKDNLYTDFTVAAPTSGAGSFNANTNNSSISRVRVSNAVGSNHYQRHSWSGVNSAKAIEDTWFPGSQSAAVAGGVVNNVGKYDYSVWDFEVGTDMYSFSYTANVTDGSATSQSTLKMTVASQEEFNEYLEEFERYKADSNPNIEKYPLMKKLSYTVSGKSVTSIESIDAAQTLELAFLQGTSIAYTFRGYTYNADGTAWSASNKEVWGRIGSFNKQSDGWYLVDPKDASNKVRLANEIGKFDHITYVFKITEGTANADGRIRLVVNLYTFINGEYFSTITTSNNDYEQLLPQRLSLAYPKDSLLSYGWAFATDNFAVNHYANYSNTDPNGIGNLITSGNYKTTSLLSCTDVLYNKNYISPNGYVSVDGIKSSFAIDELIKTVENNSEIKITVDLLNFKIPSGVDTFTVQSLNGSKFTLDSESAADFVAVRGSNGMYTVRRGTPDDYITINWTYIDGDEETILKSEKISFDVVPEFALKKNFDFDTMTYTESGYFDWMFDVDGDASNFGPLYDEEVNLYDPEPIRALTATEVFLIREELGGELKVYTSTKSEVSTDLSESQFVVGTYDKDGAFLPSFDSKGGYTQYASMDNFKTEFQAAASGSTVILTYDLNTKYDIGVQTNNNASIKIGEGKTISLDLNGRTLVDGYSNYNVGAWGNTTGCAFNVGEGSTFNFYSSKAGAVWYQLKYSSSGDAKVYSKGVVTSNAKNATVNFGDVYNEEGKLIIDSADFDVYGSLILADTASGAAKDNTNFVLNVNGGNYYQFGIGRYGMIVSYLPKMTINIKDATFVNDGARPSYAIFSNWFNNNSAMYINAYNSSFICPDAASPLITNGYYKEGDKEVALTVDSQLYFENCTVIAKSFNATKVTLGAGNYVSCAGSTTYADGVITGETNVEKSVTLYHAKVVNALPTDATNSFKSATINGTTYYTIADSVYDTANWKNETVSFTGFTTVVDNSVPEGSEDETLTPGGSEGNDGQSGAGEDSEVIQGSTTETPVTQSGIGATNTNGSTVGVEDTNEPELNGEILSTESNGANLTLGEGASAGNSDSSAWVIVAVSIIAVAFAAFMLAKRRSEN